MDDIKKYCGLLMFDTDLRSTRNDYTNSSTREVDTNALAAGAAAADQSNTVNVDNDGERTDTSRRTPRPPNAFILYRQAKQPALIASQHLTNAQVSRKISEMWKNESEEVRLHWEKMADKKKLEHMNRFPNYVYKPNKNKPKVDKRKEKRKQSLAAASMFNGSNDVSSGTGPIRPKTKKATRSTVPPLSAHANQQNQTIINSTTYIPSQTNIVPHIISTEMLLPEFYQQQMTQTSALHENGLKIHHRLRHQLHNQIQRVVPEEEEGRGFAPNSGTATTFAPIEATPYAYGTTIQPIDGYVPDVAHSSQQIFSEYLLNQEPPSPTTCSTASNSPITTQSASEEFFQQTYPPGTYADLLVSTNYALEFLDGSVSHNGGFYQ